MIIQPNPTVWFVIVCCNNFHLKSKPAHSRNLPTEIPSGYFITITHHRLLVFIWFDASDEERIALAQSLHQRLQGLLELRGEGGGALPRLRAHVEVLAEEVLQELVLGHVDELQQVRAERVAVLLEEVARVVENHAGEVVEPEGGVDVRLGLEIVPVVAVFLVEFVQHCLVRAL